MNEKIGKDKNFEDIKKEYHKQLETIDEKNSNYRKELPDEHCKKIYDALFLHLKTKNVNILKFKEILNLTGMTRPTLSLHLKHLEERKFITKEVETRYKTAYRINLTKVIKVCKIKKTITGKEKLELIDLGKLRTGDSFIPMEPIETIPIGEGKASTPPSNRKSRVYFKAHKNKR